MCNLAGHGSGSLIHCGVIRKCVVLYTSRWASMSFSQYHYGTTHQLNSLIKHIHANRKHLVSSLHIFIFCIFIYSRAGAFQSLSGLLIFYIRLYCSFNLPSLTVITQNAYHNIQENELVIGLSSSPCKPLKCNYQLPTSQIIASYNSHYQDQTVFKFPHQHIPFI